jgi:hypothetical protein
LPVEHQKIFCFNFWFWQTTPPDIDSRTCDGFTETIQIREEALWELNSPLWRDNLEEIFQELDRRRKKHVFHKVSHVIQPNDNVLMTADQWTAPVLSRQWHLGKKKKKNKSMVTVEEDVHFSQARAKVRRPKEKVCRQKEKVCRQKEKVCRLRAKKGVRKKWEKEWEKEGVAEHLVATDHTCDDNSAMLGVSGKEEAKKA